MAFLVGLIQPGTYPLPCIRQIAFNTKISSTRLCLSENWQLHHHDIYQLYHLANSPPPLTLWSLLAAIQTKALNSDSGRK